MKTTFIGHAAILAETHGLRILSDPWWQGPCFGAQWHLHPEPALAAVDQAPIDAIYISHGHADHLHLGTLRRFPRDTRILVATDHGLEAPLTDLGFAVTAVAPSEPLDLGRGVTCRILPTHDGDTLMALHDGSETLLNLNDALHSADAALQDRFIATLRTLYPRIDYVFCGYGIASHFPNAFNIPCKDPEATAIARQHHFNQQWVRLIAGLEPAFGFPFAAGVVFLDEDLFWANEPVHNGERPTDLFRALHPDSKTRVIDIAPGFTIEDGMIRDERLFTPVRADDLRRRFAADLSERAREKPVDDATVDHLAQKLADNVALCRRYLQEFPGDYQCRIALRNAASGILVSKQGDRIEVVTLKPEDMTRRRFDLTVRTRASYLRRALTTPYGHEVLFVGSGIVFDYADRRRVRENLHGEISALLRQRTAPPRSRWGDQPKFLYDIKTRVKALVKPRETDLYDLDHWTVYRE